MTYQAKVIAGGKIVTPAELRRDAGIKEGDSLVIEREDDGTISLRTFEQVVREEQRRFRTVVGPDYTLDDFLAERRADRDAED